MYVVIFRANIINNPAAYSDMAAQLSQLAFERYGCIDFHCTTEGNQEIALSYWHSMEDIARWKNDPLHIEAQKIGARDWYQDYSVDVCEVLKKYQNR